MRAKFERRLEKAVDESGREDKMRAKLEFHSSINHDRLILTQPKLR